MALTVADVFGPAPYADRWIVCKKVTFDNSYAASGGESLTYAQLGFADTPDVVRVTDNTASGYVIKYDSDAKKLIAYQQTDPADTGGADIALTEVASTTDLSAVSVYVEAVGIHAAA